jgi:hypothetical protein
MLPKRGTLGRSTVLVQLELPALAQDDEAFSQRLGEARGFWPHCAAPPGSARLLPLPLPGSEAHFTVLFLQSVRAASAARKAKRAAGAAPQRAARAQRRRHNQ